MSRPETRRRMWRRSWPVCAAACLIAGGLFVIDVRGRLESFVFYLPTRERFETPPWIEDVWIDRPQGRLHGWFIPPTGWRQGDAPFPAILHVHGNAGNVSSHVDASAFLTRDGFGVLVFDYRGYGRSDRGAYPRRETLLADTHAALDALLDRPDVDRERIGVLGFSLGGVIGLALAAQRQEVGAVASIAAFETWRGIAADHAGALGRMLIRPGMDAGQSIKLLGGRPVLIMHGSEDRIVPVAHARRLDEVARHEGIASELVILDGAGHNDILFEGGQERRLVSEFFARALESGGAG